MSLYNNIASSSGGGLFGEINSMIGSTFKGAASSVASALGGGKFATAVTNIGANMATRAAVNAINKGIPLSTRKAINLGAGVLGDIASGDWDGAGMRVLNSGMLGQIFGASSADSLAAQEAYWGAPTPLFGGISPSEAKQIYDDMQANQFSKKNLFLIEVSSPIDGGGESQRFNMFATDVEYAPFTVSADKKKIGGAVIDCAQGGEAVELRMTTLDDSQGSLKMWFASHYGEVSHSDGTMGVPADYAITIKIVHSVISDRQTGYTDIGLYRVGNLDISKSRREDGLEELQMTFSQLDTFMSPG